MEGTRWHVDTNFGLLEFLHECDDPNVPVEEVLRLVEPRVSKLFDYYKPRSEGDSSVSSSRKDMFLQQLSSATNLHIEDTKRMYESYVECSEGDPWFVLQGDSALRRAVQFYFSERLRLIESITVATVMAGDDATQIHRSSLKIFVESLVKNHNIHERLLDHLIIADKNEIVPPYAVSSKWEEQAYKEKLAILELLLHVHASQFLECSSDLLMRYISVFTSETKILNKNSEVRPRKGDFTPRELACVLLLQCMQLDYCNSVENSHPYASEWKVIHERMESMVNEKDNAKLAVALGWACILRLCILSPEDTQDEYEEDEDDNNAECFAWIETVGRRALARDEVLEFLGGISQSCSLLRNNVKSVVTRDIILGFLTAIVEMHPDMDVYALPLTEILFSALELWQKEVEHRLLLSSEQMNEELFEQITVRVEDLQTDGWQDMREYYLRHWPSDAGYELQYWQCLCSTKESALYIYNRIRERNLFVFSTETVQCCGVSVPESNSNMNELGLQEMTHNGWKILFSALIRYMTSYREWSGSVERFGAFVVTNTLFLSSRLLRFEPELIGSFDSTAAEMDPNELSEYQLGIFLDLICRFVGTMQWCNTVEYDLILAMMECLSAMSEIHFDDTLIFMHRARLFLPPSDSRWTLVSVMRSMEMNSGSYPVTLSALRVILRCFKRITNGEYTNRLSVDAHKTIVDMFTYTRDNVFAVHSSVAYELVEDRWTIAQTCMAIFEETEKPELLEILSGGIYRRHPLFHEILFDQALSQTLVGLAAVSSLEVEHLLHSERPEGAAILRDLELRSMNFVVRLLKYWQSLRLQELNTFEQLLLSLRLPFGETPVLRVVLSHISPLHEKKCEAALDICTHVVRLSEQFDVPSLATFFGYEGLGQNIVRSLLYILSMENEKRLSLKSAALRFIAQCVHSQRGIAVRIIEAENGENREGALDASGFIRSILNIIFQYSTKESDKFLLVAVDAARVLELVVSSPEFHRVVEVLCEGDDEIKGLTKAMENILGKSDEDSLSGFCADIVGSILHVLSACEGYKQMNFSIFKGVSQMISKERSHLMLLYWEVSIEIKEIITLVLLPTKRKSDIHFCWRAIEVLPRDVQRKLNLFSAYVTGRSRLMSGFRKFVITYSSSLGKFCDSVVVERLVFTLWEMVNSFSSHVCAKWLTEYFLVSGKELSLTLLHLAQHSPSLFSADSVNNLYDILCKIFLPPETRSGHDFATSVSTQNYLMRLWAATIFHAREVEEREGSDPIVFPDLLLSSISKWLDSDSLFDTAVILLARAHWTQLMNRQEVIDTFCKKLRTCNDPYSVESLLLLLVTHMNSESPSIANFLLSNGIISAIGENQMISGVQLNAYSSSGCTDPWHKVWLNVLALVCAFIDTLGGNPRLECALVDFLASCERRIIVGLTLGWGELTLARLQEVESISLLISRFLSHFVTPPLFNERVFHPSADDMIKSWPRLLDNRVAGSVMGPPLFIYDALVRSAAACSMLSGEDIFDSSFVRFVPVSPEEKRTASLNAPSSPNSPSRLLPEIMRRKGVKEETVGLLATICRTPKARSRSEREKTSTQVDENVEDNDEDLVLQFYDHARVVSALAMNNIVSCFRHMIFRSMMANNGKLVAPLFVVDEQQLLIDGERKPSVIVLENILHGCMSYLSRMGHRYSNVALERVKKDSVLRAVLTVLFLISVQLPSSSEDIPERRRTLDCAREAAQRLTHIIGKGVEIDDSEKMLLETVSRHLKNIYEEWSKRRREMTRLFST